jgi:hypothetical protein
MFANNGRGQAQRLAYHERRKPLPPASSLLDSRDVFRGRETPAERRARDGRASGR